jgi:hypothetical protein
MHIGSLREAHRVVVAGADVPALREVSWREQFDVETDNVCLGVRIGGVPDNAGEECAAGGLLAEERRPVCFIVDVDEAHMIRLEGVGTVTGEDLVEAKLQVEVDIVNASYRVTPEALFLKIASRPIGGDGDVPERDQDEDADDRRPAQNFPVDFPGRRCALCWGRSSCLRRFGSNNRIF